MLEQKSGNQRAEQEPAPAASDAEHDAGKGQDRSVGLDRALDVPFGIELAQAPGDVLRFGRMPSHAAFDIGLDAAVDLVFGAARDALCAGDRHGALHFRLPASVPRFPCGSCE